MSGGAFSRMLRKYGGTSVRRSIRTFLLLALVASMTVTAVAAYRVATSPMAGLLQDRGVDALAAAHERALTRAATPTAITARTEALLAESPRNWIALDAVAEVAEAQGVILPDAVVRERARLHALDHGVVQRTLACAACAADLSACALSFSLTCGLVVQVTAVGDLVSLGREANNHLAGRDVDLVDLTLSFIGLGAAGLVVVSGGSSAAVKTGAASLKTANAMGRLNPGVLAPLHRAARDGIAWSEVPRVRSRDDLAALVRPEIVRPALRLTGDIGRLSARMGPGRTLALMAHLDTAEDARRMARAADAIGPRTLGAVEVMGKTRFLRVGMRLADGVGTLLAGLLATLAAVGALLWSALTNAGLRHAHRRSAR